MGRTPAGAQTERRGSAGPVRACLGGRTPPAAVVSGHPCQSEPSARRARHGGPPGGSENSRLSGRASHTFAVRSWLPVRTRDPSALNDADVTIPVCPLRVSTSAPLLASHTRAVRSSPPVTIRDPSALNDAERMPSVCPRRVSSSAPLLAPHTFAVLSWLPVRTRDPY